ncbi:MAG: antibiotic biosynthesis monooxygenase [Desulfobacteraceae bacterium]|nr:antibiotic biosynthesis monooxygenase [Desulfobacteraceae bacterium]
MAIKIIIKRRVPKDKAAELLPLFIQLRALATARPGYISGETLRNIDDPQEFLVIGTWQSLDNWQSWVSSKQRTEIQERVDTLLGERTEYSSYFYG